MTNLIRLQTFDLVQHFQQVGQPRGLLAAAIAIAVHCLAQQRNFERTLIGQHLGLGQNVFRPAALLGAANHGHDAVGAELVAADLNSHERLVGRGPHGGIAQRVERFVAAADGLLRAVATTQADFHLLAVARLDTLDQLGHGVQLAGAHNEIDIRRPAKDELLVLLRHAAQHADDFFGVIGLQLLELAQGAVGFALGVFTHAARVEENRIGRRGRIGQLVALFAERGHHQLAIEHVHLAADGFDVESLHGSWPRLADRGQGSRANFTKRPGNPSMLAIVPPPGKAGMAAPAGLTPPPLPAEGRQTG